MTEIIYSLLGAVVGALLGWLLGSGWAWFIDLLHNRK